MVVLVISLLILILLFQSSNSSYPSSPFCYNSTNTLECSRYSYDFNCLTKDYPFGTTWGEIIECSYCCIVFWLKRLHPHHYSNDAISKDNLLVNEVGIWRDLFHIIDQSKAMSAIQIKYQHVCEPTIRFVQSFEELTAIVSNVQRNTVFVTTNFSQLVASADIEKNFWEVLSSDKVIHLYSYESIVSLFHDSPENNGNNSDNGNNGGNGCSDLNNRANGGSSSDGNSTGNIGNDGSNSNFHNGTDNGIGNDGNHPGNACGNSNNGTKNGFDNATARSDNTENGGSNVVGNEAELTSRMLGRHLLSKSDIISKVTFIPKPTLYTYSLTGINRGVNSDFKENILICLTSSNKLISQKDKIALISLCSVRGFPMNLCELCVWRLLKLSSEDLNGNGIQRNDKARSMQNNLKQDFLSLNVAKFVLSISDDLSQMDFVQNTLLASTAIPIISKSVLQNECSSVKINMDCLSWTTNKFSGKKLPIVYIEMFSQQQQDSLSKSRSLRMLAKSISSDMTTLLNEKYNEITSGRTNEYSVSSLLFAYHLARLAPYSQILQHIGRQGSRYNQFTSEFMPAVKNIINQSPMVVTSYFYRYQYKLKPLCMIDHVPFSAPNDHTIITPETIENTVLLPSKRAYRNQGVAKQPLLKKPVLEIVLPRCCESSEGDLSWLKSILQDYQTIDGFLRVSVYYKCPWCIPISKANEWMGEYDRYFQYLEEEVANNSNTSSTNLLTSGYEVLVSKGGILLLDEIVTPKHNAYDIVREYPAFDWFVNGKEITAYLKHILLHYENHQLANFTMFLHTQPTHHLEFQRFLEIFKHLKLCHHDISAMTDYQQHIPLDSKIEYIHLNYRWMEGIWAHQPESCMIDVLEQIFQGSSELGDERRVPPASKTVKDFLQIPMASGVAAQFLVTDFTVYRRPKTFWEKLYFMNNGSIAVPACNNRSYKEGTEVASAMERIWHNFFRDMSFEEVLRPKKCQDLVRAKNRTTFPLYMEDFPQCCIHQLPSHVITATSDPTQANSYNHGANSDSSGCFTTARASSVSNSNVVPKEGDKKRHSNSNFRPSKFAGGRRPP